MVLLEAYPQTIEPKNFFIVLVFFLAIFFLYLLRDIPGFKTLWRLVLIFFLVLAGTLMWDGIKKNIKDFFRE